ncbi:insulinoma-associated protein 2-like [Mya arenaria]|uniref:insulinoma-associated protein 2-like n=1 Tax=Mya arenaria TaxID=6604 RepID=UPI0022E17072|nr:insulinoma-associated protein 2-like [Mya arenaria]
MPRGFLVKRTKNTGQFSYRIRHCSDEDRSESGSDQEYVQTNFGSPDSGYSASPTFATFRERYGHYGDIASYAQSPLASPQKITYGYPSPLCYSNFDRLSVCYDAPLDLKINKTNNINYDDEKPLDFSKTPLKSPSPERIPVPPAKFEPSTPISPNKRRGNSDGSENKLKVTKKPKAARKINFDEDNSSPVSGTIIRKLTDEVDGARIVCGDIDSKFNCVEVTPEAKAELAKIENRIGEYVCRLCKDRFEDAFQLAQHRCSMIINIEYRCPECDKVFNCPANLASHRRWHKPRPNTKKPVSTPMKILPAMQVLDQAVLGQPDSIALSPKVPTEEKQFPCDQCGKKFRRQAYLKKHMQTHDTDSIYVCQYCSKIYPNDNARAKHEQTHTVGKELTCTLCNTSFPNKIVLEKHVRQHGNDKFDCKYCDNSFCSSPGLTRHINKCHPSENRQVILLQIPGNRNC